jgi:hypothetical protein
MLRPIYSVKDAAQKRAWPTCQVVGTHSRHLACPRTEEERKSKPARKTGSFVRVLLAGALQLIYGSAQRRKAQAISGIPLALIGLTSWKRREKNHEISAD